ncbi:RWD domain-containing protein 2A isoform X4 [Malaclemys terrapin pileata]|uniref:RWD domain-containing protein 2A isoform X4 n=1 Tax=Malaclemys terrapin pileata TaxID=2991368 RepID=UPI0023A81E8A|nr:RWD domain-containing protein 2A isoform X4 [Malaclemys terrapin pileata]
MAVTIKECLELQLLEMEMLFSMFPNKGEISLQDKNALTYVQMYLKNIKEGLPPRIEYSISVDIDEPKRRAYRKEGESTLNLFGGRGGGDLWAEYGNIPAVSPPLRMTAVKVDLHVSLPHRYPHSAPQLFARSNALDRQNQLQLNKHLTSHISSLDLGELCVCAAVQWVRDNSASYFQNSNISSETAPKEKAVKIIFHRMWIYSHHIYRQELKKKIFDCAKQLNLTGFCLTGKPGIICVEGLKENCEEFWHVIRYPNWKHISCKHVESMETEGNGDKLHLFHTFEDLQFQAHGDYGLRNDYHMDLGQFLEFLKQHQSEHIFQLLFGVESKHSDN